MPCVGLRAKTIPQPPPMFHFLRKHGNGSRTPWDNVLILSDAERHSGKAPQKSGWTVRIPRHGQQWIIAQDRSHGSIATMWWSSSQKGFSLTQRAVIRLDITSGWAVISTPQIVLDRRNDGEVFSKDVKDPITAKDYRHIPPREAIRSESQPASGVMRQRTTGRECYAPYGECGRCIIPVYRKGEEKNG